MKRDFSAIARFWVDIYGDDILQLPRKRVVEFANECIDAGLVPKMAPVLQAEGAYLVSDIEIELAEAARVRNAADAAMPKLTGTQKRVRWAEEIRMEAITNAYRLIREAKQQQNEIKAMRLAAYMEGKLRKENTAQWFIENRLEFDGFQTITKQKADSIPKKYTYESLTESEARKEIALHPKKLGEFHIELSLLADGTIALAERNHYLVRIARKHQLMWDAKILRWYKVPPVDNAQGHAAEIVADLVENGIIVEVCDDEVRRLAQAIILEHQNEPPMGDHQS